MTFEQFLALPPEEQSAVFTQTSTSMGVNAMLVEKDFWVCLTLKSPFNHAPFGTPRILFKGGTSLSKAFGMIKRFSEDIDIVVSREDLGFSGDMDPFSGQQSAKRLKTLTSELKSKCQLHMRNELAPSLANRLKAIGAQCEVTLSEDDPDNQTLLVSYPTLFDIDGLEYVRPAVRVEGGARSALEPAVVATVHPYIAEEIPDAAMTVSNVLTISYERTLWEKALILHGLCAGFRDDPAMRLPGDNNRQSRHYYDLAVMAASPEGKVALANAEILKDVRTHNILAFPQRWKKFEEAVPGTLRIVPQPALRAAIEKDYAAMQSMIFGEPPKFDWIMEQLEIAERAVNN